MACSSTGLQKLGHGKGMQQLLCGKTVIGCQRPYRPLRMAPPVPQHLPEPVESHLQTNEEEWDFFLLHALQRPDGVPDQRG
jgi:hypothetical protein